MIYNNTGNSFSHTGLDPDTTYYYQAWSYNSTTGLWNETYVSASNTTDSPPPSNNPPTQTGESPTNESIGISTTPDLYVICIDPDDDYMNAAWWSNSSGSWVQFAYNNTFANNTNITQPFTNATEYLTTYWWSVNLTDGNGGWCNKTYHFTTKIPKTWQALVTWNGSLYNITNWQQLLDWNGTIYNTSSWNVISDINGTIYNLSSWHNLVDWNGSIHTVGIGATPFNIDLYVHNPNPGDGTHVNEATGFGVGANYLRRSTSGLTTSVDVVYRNFTTPAALMPGDYSMEFDSLNYNGPSLENNSGVYMNVNLNTSGRVIPGHEWVGQYNFAGNYYITRAYLIFDTAALPDEAVINSAYITMVIRNDYSDVDFNVTITEVRPPAPHNPIQPLDYLRNSFVTEYNSRNTSGYTDEDWFNFTLPADAWTGPSYSIDPTGDSYFGLRSSKDVAQSPPGVGTDEWIGFYGPGGVEPLKAPHLIINYTIPSSNWMHIVNLSWQSNSTGLWVEYYKSFVTGNGTVTVPNVNFTNVSRYWWYTSWESNHTVYGNSSIWVFETVAIGGGEGGPSIIIGQNDISRFLLVGLLVSLIILLIVARRRRKQNEEEE